MIEFIMGLILWKIDKLKILKWNYCDYKLICDISIYKKKNYNFKDDK